jgi:hypothetical protein
MTISASGLVLVLAIAQAASAPAQAPYARPANPVTDEVRAVLARESKNLTGSAELMPADKYSFRPTPAQWTFGELMAHVIETNFAICGGVADVAIPMTPNELGNIDDKGGKEKLLPLLRQSFDFCGKAFAVTTDATLAQEARMFGRGMNIPRAKAVITIAVDWADHYATAAGYLRLNGILPPSATPPVAR